MSILSTSSKLVRVGDSYSAGEGISIENNTISVTGDYGHAYYPGENISISDDNVISSKDWSSDIDTAVQNASAETTAWVDSQNYLTDASMSDYALITDVETTSGLLKMGIDTVSGSISGKMDSTAFNDWQNGQYSSDIAVLTNNIDAVSGAVDVISGAVSSLDIPTHQEIENASGYAYSQSTAWTDSQGYLTQHQPISADEWNDSYETVLANSAQWSENTGDEDVNNAVYNNSAKWNEIEVYQTNSSTYLTAHQDISNKLDTTAFSTVSGTFLTAVDLSNYYTKSQTSGADELANAFANIPAGDADVNAYVQGNSATIDNVNSTVQTNSAQWAEGTSVDTIPVAVISPLVTGFSGESAYLGIESTALNLSSYVPVSAIGVDSNYDLVNKISGLDISAYYSRNALTANYAYTASRSYSDRNGNEIASYYQPKLTISGDAGTITSINGSAVGATIPEGWELVAGAGISIVDDAENNQTTISVTAAGGNPEVESYVQTNSASIDDAVSTYQTNSGSYITQETDWTNTITAASSYAYSEAVAQIPAPFDPTYLSGAIDQNASDIQYISGVAITAHQDISNKLDTTAFSNVSGSFLTAVNIPESANDAITAYQTYSGTYLTAHQSLDGYLTKSSADTLYQPIGSYASQTNLEQVSGDLKDDIDYISGVAITALPGDLATTGDVNDLAQSISETYQVKGDYLTNADSANFYPMTGNPSGFLTSHQDISNKLDTTAFSDVSGSFLTAVNIPESANWNDATTAYQTNSGRYLTAHQPISAEEWNSNYDTVTTNSGAWGGSALNISAGPGINVNLVDNTLVFSADYNETVLWSGTLTANQTANLSENVFNFDTIKIYAHESQRNRNLVTEYKTTYFANNTQIALTIPDLENSDSLSWFAFYWSRLLFTDSSCTAITNYGGKQTWWSMASNASLNVVDNRYCIVDKIVGINRI